MGKGQEKQFSAENYTIAYFSCNQRAYISQTLQKRKPKTNYWKNSFYNNYGHDWLHHHSKEARKLILEIKKRSKFQELIIFPIFGENW